MQIKESNVTVMVKDMDQAVHFYSQLGLQLKQRWENHYAMLTAPGLVIGLHPAKQTNAENTNISIGFMIDDISEAKTLLDNMHVHTQRMKIKPAISFLSAMAMERSYTSRKSSGLK